MGTIRHVGGQGDTSGALGIPTNAPPVIIYWAPPGYGKTKHLRHEADKCAARGIATIRFSLAMISTRFASFSVRFVQALAEVGIDIGFTEGMCPVDVAECTVLALARTNKPIAILLDDFDKIDDTGTLTFFKLLSVSLPAPSRLCLSTWDHPGLDLIQLDLDAKVLIFGPDDLRLLDSDVKDQIYPQASQSDIDALIAMTNNWPGAVKLAVQLRDSTPDPRDWLDRLPPALLRYFAEQILSQLPNDLVDVLLCLSQTEVFEGGLIDQLTHSASGWDKLTRLCDLGLVQPFDPGESLFRIRAPYQAPLKRLFSRQSAMFQQEKCRIIANWFAARSAFDIALSLADIIGDHALTVSLIERAGSWRLAIDRSNDILSEYLPKLDDKAFASSPRIRLADVLLIARSGDPGLARLKFNEIDVVDPSDTTLGLEAEIVESLVAIYEDKPGTPAMIERLQTLLVGLPGKATPLHADVHYILFFFYFEAGNLQNAVKSAERARTIFFSTHLERSRLHLEVHLGAALQAMGHLAQAKTCLENVIRESRKKFGPESVFEALASLHLASIFYQQDNFPDASALIAKSLRLLERNDCWCTPLILGYRVAANLARVASGNSGVQDVLNRAEKIADKRRMPRLRQVMSILRIIENIKSGKRILAIELADKIGLDELARLDTSGHRDQQTFDSQVVVNFARVAQARIWITSGNADKAIDMLNVTSKMAKQNGADNYRIRALALRAIAEDSIGLRQTAIETLLEAIGVGQHEGYFRVFLDLGVPMERLIGVALRTLSDTQRYQTRYQYLTHLNKAFRDTKKSISVLAGGVKLTRREMEVVDLLGAGMSNSEMARMLNVTPDTIKFHLKKIYKKFGVNRRQDVIPKIERDFT